MKTSSGLAAALSILIFCGLLGCMSTTVIVDPKWDSMSRPVYTDYMDSFLLGFVGSSSVSLSRVCLDQKPHAVERVKSGEDIFLSFITLGIYTPTTVKVWCGE